MTATLYDTTRRMTDARDFGVPPAWNAVVNVKTMGAKGTGTVDDTAAIMAAESVRAAIGGVLFFPPGVYLVSALSCSAVTSAYWVGSGPSTIIRGTTTTGWVVTFDPGSGFAFHNGISNIAICHDTGTQGATFGALLLNRQQDFKLEEVYLNPGGGLPSTSLGLKGDLQTGVTTNRCRISALLDGVTMTGGSGMAGADVFVITPGRDGFVLDGCAGMNVYNYQSYGAVGRGWRIQKTGAVDNTNMFFTQCMGDTSGDSNWSITSGTRFLFDTCWGATQGSVLLHTGAGGFDISGVSNVLMTNCTAMNNNGNGVYVTGSNHVTLSACHLYANGRSGAPGSGHGLLVDAASGVVANMLIEGCSAWDDGALAGGQKQGYGLATTGTPNFWTFSGNDFSGNLLGAYTAAGTGNVTLRLDTNQGINPLSVSTPSVPISTAGATNTSGVNVMVYIKTDGATTVSAIAVNGSTTGFTMAVSSQLAVRVPAGGSITLTYAGGTPTWTWIGE